MSHTKVSTYVETVAALADKIRPVITERNLICSEPKMVRRTLRRMIQDVCEDETVILSASNEKERARAERKKLLFSAQRIVTSLPSSKTDALLDDAIAQICVRAGAATVARSKEEAPHPEVSIKDWATSEPRREAAADVVWPLFVSPGRS